MHVKIFLKSETKKNHTYKLIFSKTVKFVLLAKAQILTS
jgi:hypothetical protein